MPDKIGRAERKGGHDEGIDWSVTSGHRPKSLDTILFVSTVMARSFNGFLDRLESRISLGTILYGSVVFVVGSITSFLSQSDLFLKLGVFGWWLSGLIGSFGFAVVLLILAIGRFYWIKSAAFDKWSSSVDSVNPLDDSFNKLRINLKDIADPFTKMIENKKFTNCEIFGPINIVFGGGSDIYGNVLLDCDIIPLKEAAIVHNAIFIRNTSISHSKLVGVTVLIDGQNIDQFENFRPGFIAYTKEDIRPAG